MSKVFASFLISLMFLTACTPRDTAVMSPEDRAALDKKGSNKNGTPASQGPSKDDMVLAAHLVERQAEALQMLTWIQDSASFNRNQDASKQALISATKADQQTLHFKFTKSAQNYLNYKTTLSGAIHANVSMVPNADPAELAKIEITSIGFATYLQVNNSKDTLQAIDTKRELTVSPVPGTVNEFDVVYSTETNLAINKNGQYDNRTLYPLVEMRVRIDWFNKTMELLSSNGNVRSYTRFMEQNISSTDLKMSFDGCAKITGSVKVSGKGDGELKSDENGFTSSGWSSASAPCEQRPTLDWRRFLE